MTGTSLTLDDHEETEKGTAIGCIAPFSATAGCLATHHAEALQGHFHWPLCCRQNV